MGGSKTLVFSMEDLAHWRMPPRGIDFANERKQAACGWQQAELQESAIIFPKSPSAFLGPRAVTRPAQELPMFGPIQLFFPKVLLAHGHTEFAKRAGRLNAEGRTLNEEGLVGAEGNDRSR
jgi:hypothetical protein